MASRSTRRSGACGIDSDARSVGGDRRRSSGWRSGRIEQMTITNVADPATRLALMYEAVAMLCSDAKFGLVISHQVMSFIDGLARSPKVAVGNGFDQIVPLVLPQLCALVPARDLRVHFRNKLVHEFGILPPYAIGWDEA